MRAARLTAGSAAAPTQIGGCGRCNGRGTDRNVLELDKLAFVGGVILFPQQLQCLQLFVKQLGAPFPVHPEVVILDITIAQGSTKDQLATRDDVDRGVLFGDVDDVVQRQHKDIRPQLHVTGIGSKARNHRRRLQELIGIGQIVLGKPQRIKARIADDLCLFDMVFKLLADIRIRHVLRAEKYSNFHILFPFINSCPAARKASHSGWIATTAANIQAAKFPA